MQSFLQKCFFKAGKLWLLLPFLNNNLDFLNWLLGYFLSPPPSCVSDAWSLLKRSHTESEDMIMYFIQACRDFNLGAEALKYIPEGYDVR